MRDSTRLSAAGGVIHRLLLLARSEALSRNIPVEVRFCRAGSGEPVRVVDLQAYYTDGRVEPLVRPVSLPGNLVIDPDPLRSTLFGLANAAASAGSSAFVVNPLPQATIPDLGSGYEVFTLFIRPDGSTTLPQATSGCPFLTVRADQPGATGLPADFVTIQMDPVTAEPSVFRP